MTANSKFLLIWLVMIAIGLLLDIREFLIWAGLVGSPLSFNAFKQKK